MKKNAPFLILAIGLLFSASPLIAQDATVVDTLSSPANIRPIDSFKDDTRWNTASSDLFTYWIDNGMYGFYGPQPEILIDGIPVDANFFGWQNLNMLPISDEHERTYNFMPQVFQHNLSPAGYFNFKSKPLESGFSADVSYHVGNETGDPGPYIYDSLKASPNIDRWGPDGEFTLSYKTGDWYSKGRFVFRNHLPTDLASNARLHFTASLLGTNQQYVNHRVFSSAKSGFFETGYNTDAWGVSSRATYGQSKDYVFLQPFGREIPAKTSYSQLAINGYFKTGPWRLNSRYIGHQKMMDKRIDLHPYIFDWDQRKHTIAFSADYITDNISLTPGITYDRIKTFAPGLDKAYNDLMLFSIDAAIHLSEFSELKANISADYDEDQTAKSFQFSFPTTITPHWTMTPQVISTQLLPIRQHSFSYWVNRGYTFADELDIPYAGLVNVSKDEITVLKLQNNFTISPDVSLTLEQQLIDHRSLNIPFQQVEAFEFVTDTEPGIFTVSQETGSRLGLFTQIKHSFSNLFQHSLSVNIQRTISGSERYEQYFKQTPETKIQYQLDVRPVHSLLLSLNTLYRSSTTWNEFAAIEGNQYRLPSGIPIPHVTGTFDTTTPAFTDISFSIQKWFWQRRLNARFSLNNILNNELRMHPLGADLNTKFDVKVSLNI